MTEIGVALIGYNFMGRAHSNAYRQVGPFFEPRLTPRLKVLCGRNASAVEAAAARLGFEEWATDWREVVKREDIGLVDVKLRATRTPRSPSPRPGRERRCSARSRSPTP